MHSINYQKLIIILSLIFYGLIGSAQTNLQNGYSLLGGGFNVRFQEFESPYFVSTKQTNTSKTEMTVFSLSPYYGLMVDEKNMLGGYLEVEYSERSSDRIFYTSDNNYVNEYGSRAAGLGIFHRRYIPASDRFGCFFQTNIGFKRKVSNAWYQRFSPDYIRLYDYSYKIQEEENQLHISSSFGIYYFVTSSFAIESRLRLGGFHLQKTTFTDYYNNYQGQGYYIDEFTNYVFGVTKMDEQSVLGFSWANRLILDQLITLNLYF